MTKSIFNKGAFEIKAKAYDATKYLDGGYRMAIKVTHYESGEKIVEHIELYKNCLGQFSVDLGIGL